MISDTELLAEIQTDPIGLGFAGAGAIPIYEKLNAEGSASVETWIVADGPKPVSKTDFLQKIGTVEEAAAFEDTETVSASSVAKAIRFKLRHTPTLDMTLQQNRDIVVALTALDDIPIVDKPFKTVTRDAILRLGEVRQSRSQELWGESVTIEQIRGVL